MTFPPLHRLVCICAVLLLTSGVTVAQHDPVTGGGMIGGSTERSTKPKTTKPASTTTTTPRKRPTPATVKRPAPVTSTVTADSYYQQGEALYKEKKYREALDPYLKATQINPSMSSALYRIGWIYNDLEDYESAVDPMKRVIAIQPNTPRPISSWAILTAS